MHVHVVYCHPSTASFAESFTWHLKQAFVEGLRAAGHSFTLSDLYAMKFRSDLSEAEYTREVNYDAAGPIAADVRQEQERLDASSAVAFIYPVFWTEAPAKLVGWFQRVWTAGYAHTPQAMQQLDKAIFLCSVGNSLKALTENGTKAAMETVMLNDRIAGRAAQKTMHFFDETVHNTCAAGSPRWEAHLTEARRLGVSF